MTLDDLTVVQIRSRLECVIEVLSDVRGELWQEAHDASRLQLEGAVKVLHQVLELTRAPLLPGLAEYVQERRFRRDLPF